MRRIGRREAVYNPNMDDENQIHKGKKQMETIQITVSTQLARKLQPYTQDLTRILEWGLRYAEEKSGTILSAVNAPEQSTIQKLTIDALRQAGAVGPEPEAITAYLALNEERAWAPIIAAGRPASEIIMEDRESYRTTQQ